MDNPKGYLAQLGGGSMYEHGIATLALIELYGMDPTRTETASAMPSP